MKSLIFLSLFSTFLFAQFQNKNYIGFEYKSYLKNQDKKFNNNSAFTFQSEIEYESENWKIYSLIDSLKDTKEEQRDYIDLKELYFSKSFDDFDFYLGKKVIFLGSLEGSNIVDIFNRQNYQKNPLSKLKRGANSLSIKYFFEDDSNLDFHIKFLEDDIKMPSSNSPYFPFSSLKYSKEINFANQNEMPSFLLNYSTSIDDEIIADSAFGFFYGYDENILYEKKVNSFNPFLFQSAKAFTHNTFILEDTMFKLEASYTKIMKDKDFELKDFYSLGLGSEYTIENIYESHNLGLIAEYYKSDNAFNSFNNDLFLALRYSLNDKDSSEFLLAFVKDLEESEKSAYLKYSGRLNDFLNISFDGRYIDSKSYLDEHFRLTAEIKYYF